MQPTVDGRPDCKEFMLTNDKGVTKYHHQDWFIDYMCDIQYIVE